MQKFLLLGAFVLTMTFIQCKHDTLVTVPCSGPTPTYTAMVKPVMDLHCATAGCHSALSKKGGFDLSSHAGTVEAAADEAFIGSMEHNPDFPAMPQGAAKLDEATIEKIACWTKNGMPK